MKVFIYDCDLYCEDCAREKIIPEIRATFPAKMTSEQRKEYKEILDDGWHLDGSGESDSPQHCGCGENCINAITGLGGSKVGVWLENPLTTDGINYVRDAIEDGTGIVWHLWQQWYADQLACKPDRPNTPGLRIFNGD